ncbi:hypothetical protein K3495_g2377 [Podosphaera aphanis]|nr:hypothetical protein K3495_g2377 [Podosphaera aphanis]
MKTLAQARQKWLFTTNQIANIEGWRRKKAEGENIINLNLSSSGLRSVFWKASLLFHDHDNTKNLNYNSWSRTSARFRTIYQTLKDSYLHELRSVDDSTIILDPLDVNNLHWDATQKDLELRAEILKDVERCMPEEPYFRKPNTQRMLLDILFIFSKENLDIGYRQGIHELLAPILWVVEQDALESNDFAVSETDPESDLLMRDILDDNFIEHDAFALLSRVMKSAKVFYQLSEPNDTCTYYSASNILQPRISPIIERSQRIHMIYLACLDPELANHLAKINVLPQIFLTRWIRLLFGGEFALDQLLELWDILFVKDPDLGLVDMICVAMLLRIRWRLIESDSTMAITILLNYPSLNSPNSPKTLIDDAIFLYENMTSDGGTKTISKYKNLFPTQNSELGSHLKMSPKLSPQKVKSPLRLPVTFFQQQRGVEALLQGAAKGVLNHGEKLGINQAVRGAVDEVRRNVQSINTSPRTPNISRRLFGDTNCAPSPQNAILAVTRRNQQLAQMLEQVTAELRIVSISGSEIQEKDINALDIAIAKVDFVRIYLEDSTIILPETFPASRSDDDPLSSPTRVSRRSRAILDTTPRKLI